MWCFPFLPIPPRATHITINIFTRTAMNWILWSNIIHTWPATQYTQKLCSKVNYFQTSQELVTSICFWKNESNVFLIVNSPFLPHLFTMEWCPLQWMNEWNGSKWMNQYYVLTLNNPPLPLTPDYYGVGHLNNFERINEWMFIMFWY